MAEVSKADWLALNDRIKALEADMVFVRAAKWFLGASIVALLGTAGTFLYNAGGAANEVKNHADRLDRAEKALADQQKENALANAHLVELLLNRVKVSALVYEGKVIKVAGDELTVHVEEPAPQDLTFTLTAETTVEIKGQNARPQDVKQGMQVRVVTGETHRAMSVVVLP